MILTPYDPNKHSSSMLQLLASHNLNEELVHTLPQFGLIAFERELPIAAGFIRQVEGNYAILDSIISNPTADPSLRHRALDLIYKKCIHIAKLNGITRLIGTTADHGILTRSLNHGFLITPHVYLIKLL